MLKRKRKLALGLVSKFITVQSREMSIAPSRVFHRIAGRILLIVTVLIAIPALALDPNRSLKEFGNQVWLTENGLPQNTVQVVTQTRDGYIWIGTQEGLARFNGNSFAVFDKDNTTQLKSNDIRALLEDRSGALWISTSYGLVRKQGTTFTAFTTAEGLPDNSIGPLLQAQDETIYIATSAGVARYANNAISAYKKDVLGETDVQMLFQDRDGVIWIGTGNGLIALKNDQTLNTKASQDLTGTSVSSGTQDMSGRLWFGTNSGVVGYDSYGRDQAANFTTKNGLPDDHVNSLNIDKEGSVWISTSGGLARLRPGNPPSISVAEGLSSTLILTAFEDREGSLWVGTESGGLNLLRDKKFTTFTTNQGLSSDLVKAIYQDHEGAIWIGTNGGGLSVLKDGAFKNYSAKDGLSSNVVLSLFGDNKGTIWVGTPDGLNQFKDGRFTTFTVAEGLASDLVRSIYVDRAENVWIGTRSGLTRIKGGEFTTFTTKDGLANDFIGAILEDFSGALWVGTRGGLSEFKSGKFTSFTTKDGLSSDVVISLHEDHEHNIWIGTNGGGLNRLQNGRVVSYTTRNGLLDNVIYRILEDGQQNLWFSSPKGIFRISLHDPNEIAEGRTQFVNTTSYGISDGMLTRECSGGGHPAGWQGVDGKLWFSTIKGVAMIDPAHIQTNQESPPVVIEEVRVDDKPVNTTGQVKVEPGTTRLDFYFTALSYVAPDKVRFKYKLDGFDPDWIEGGVRRTANYTNLRPGNYSFRVIAANNDGVWNQQGATLQFYLKPHFYQTIWFYALLVLVVAALIWQLYRMRVSRMRTQFDAVLAERTRIAREIHDNLAQEMLGISVQLEVVARTMPRDAEVAKSHLDRVRMLVRHGIAEARRYVWDLRSQALDNADLPTALSETARRLTADTNIDAQIQVSGTFRPLPRDVEDNLLRIGQEAINNAVSHAQPQHVFINLTFGARKVLLSVRDDGSGFDQTAVNRNGHFGLVGIRERAERIGGDLNISSSPGGGTEIRVEVPLTN